ncbi:tyrosine phosphatase family protein [Caulobacter sp. KR2-114]|uniref:tyrosine phosphatase family protein n=1 Tax=Caulobacter sp. KR2-114 TaxID=3400912 RepID=UPI003C0094A6
MMPLIVCPLSHVQAQVAARAPSHIITLLSPPETLATPAGIGPGRHLRLSVHDIDAPMADMVAPNAALVQRILAFGESWDEQAPMLIHCWAGISRSTATAFTLACARNPDADEMAIAMRLRAASPTAYPNRRIIALADDILGRQGRMLEAVEAMGGNNFAAEGAPFELAARH